MPYKYNPLTKSLDYYEAGVGSITLNNLSDVNTAGATNDQVLVYSSGTWVPSDTADPTAITTATTYYVDGDAGDDDNDGSDWANAKKTLDFLALEGYGAIPRELKADVTVNVRGTVLSRGTDYHTKINGFYGGGTLTIQGETSDEVTGLTPTGYSNTKTDQTYHRYITVSGETWTTNAYRGMFIQFTTPAADTMYPILSNTADTIQTTDLPDLDGTEVFKIVSLTSIIKRAQLSDPVTEVTYGTFNYDFFLLQKNATPIIFSKMDLLTNNQEASVFSSGVNETFEDIFSQHHIKLIYCRGCPWWHTTQTQGFFKRSYFESEGYQVAAAGISTVDGCIVYSSTGDGQGIFGSSNGQQWIINSRIYNILQAIYLEHSTTGVIRNTDVDGSGENAISVGYGAELRYDSGYYGPVSFTNNKVIASVSQGGRLYFQKNQPYFASGNTNDIRWNGWPALYCSLDDYMAGIKIENIPLRGSQGRAQYTPDEINNDMAFYVDGTSGSDSNDGSSWSAAKKTLDFLASDATYLLPRTINSDVTVYCRNTIYSSGTTNFAVLDNFNGKGTLTLVGETTDAQTGLTPTGWDNTRTSTTYHQYIDVAAAGWGVDAYKGGFIVFTDGTSEEWFPIISNTATRLETVALPDLAGAETFKIVTLDTKFKAATTAAPGVPVTYDGFGLNAIKLHSNSILIKFDRINIGEEFNANYMNINGTNGAQEHSLSNTLSNKSVEFTKCYLSKTWDIDAPMIVRNSFLDAVSYGGISITSKSHIYMCCIDSSDGNGNGIYIDQGANKTSIDRIRIENNRWGIGLVSGNVSIRLSYDVVLRGNGTGISMSPGGFVRLTDNFYGAWIFENNTLGIDLGGATLYYETSGDYLNYSGNTNDIKTCDNPDEFYDFSDLIAGNRIANVSENTYVIYKSGGGYNTKPEYSNSTSGLTGTTFQAAIDEIDSRTKAITSDVTYYVDGSTGDDTNDGLTWGTAKETLGFLSSQATDAIPKRIINGASITVNVRGDIRGLTTNSHTTIDGFYSESTYTDRTANSSITIAGEETVDQSGIVVTGYNNTDGTTTTKTYVEASGESWTPDEHVGKFIKFTASPNESTLYPIMSNTATKLETVGLPSLSGSSEFSIISVPRLISEIKSEPSVTKTFFSVFNVLSQRIDITVKKLDILTSLHGNVTYPVSASSGLYSNPLIGFIECSIGSPWIGEIGSFNARRCLFAPSNTSRPGILAYGISQIGIDISSSCIADPYSYGTDGIYITRSCPSPVSVSDCRVSNLNRGFAHNGSSKLSIHANSFIENCTTGIFGAISNIDIDHYLAATLSIDSCTNGIILNGSKLNVNSNITLIGTNTNDLVLADTPLVTKTFANLNSQERAYNTASGSAVTYGYMALDTYAINSEYSNSESGLTGTTFQAAIDQIAQSAATAEHFQTGFANRTDSEYSFDNGTRTFTIDVKAPATEYVYYSNGARYAKTSSDSVVIDDVSGLWFIYFNGATLVATQTWSSDIVLTYGFVALVNWSSTDAEANLIAEERHGASMAPETHEYLHQSIGTVWIEGLGLTSILPDESGDLDTHAQLGYGSGQIADEDNEFEIDAVAAPAQIPIFYRTGADGEWRRQTANNFPVVNYSGGDNLLAWNEFAGGTWQLSEVGTGDFVLIHLLATNDLDQPIVGIVGQDDYLTVSDARAGATEEISNISIGEFPTLEFKFIATVIFETKTTFGNTVKARIVTTDEGGDYVDWRQSKIASSTGAVNDHGSLSGLSHDDHVQYLLADGTRDADYIQFTTGASAPTHSEGLLFYDDDAKTIALQTKELDVTLNLGQEEFILATNKEGVQINNGQVVYIDSAQGLRPTVKLANSSDETAALRTIGVATHDIPNNGDGYITTFGLVKDLNTVGYSPGDTLWLTSTPGVFSNVQESSPARSIQVGYIVVVDGSAGSILVSIKNPGVLNNIHDVYVDTPINGQVIRYNSSNQRWENEDGEVILTDTDVDSGAAELIDALSATTYDACWWSYVVTNTDSGISKRAGEVTATWDYLSDQIRYFDTSTSDIGDTSGVTFSVSINGSSGQAELYATTTTDNWTIKIRRRAL